MDRDGTKSGYDVELLKMVTKNTNIPVIASGGVGTLEQLGHLSVTKVLQGSCKGLTKVSQGYYGNYSISDVYLAHMLVLLHRHHLLQRGCPASSYPLPWFSNPSCLHLDGVQRRASLTG
jgi:cyclase